MAAAEPNLTEIEQKLDELDKQIEDSESKQQEEFKKFQEDCQSEIRKKLDSYGKGMQCTIDLSFNSLDERMNDYNQMDIKNKQTNILRLNRIIRDVSKGIAKDWKRVYRDLMSSTDMPAEDIEKSMKRLEKHKPATQAFQGLSAWKVGSHLILFCPGGQMDNMFTRQTVYPGSSLNLIDIHSHLYDCNNDNIYVPSSI